MGRDPAKMNDVEKPEKKRYPCVYDVGPDEFPPIKDMKLGDTGEAVIRFKIKGSGIEIQSMKSLGSVASEEKAEKPGKKSALPVAAGA